MFGRMGSSMSSMAGIGHFHTRDWRASSSSALSLYGSPAAMVCFVFFLFVNLFVNLNLKNSFGGSQVVAVFLNV